MAEAAETRLCQHPEKMRKRARHGGAPVRYLERLDGAGQFLTKTLKNTSREMRLHVLAYNMKRVINLIGVPKLVEAIT